MNKVNENSVIKSITFDIKLYGDGKWYKGITINYETENPDEYLTMYDIHMEDNDTWRLIELGDTKYKFQICGDDEELEYDSGLCISLLRMEYDKKTGKLSYTDDWYETCVGMCKVKNLVVHTTDGDKRISNQIV